MTALQTSAEDLIEGTDWTGVSGDIYYTFLNPGYLPAYWLDGGSGLEDWLDDRFTDDAGDVSGVSLDQRKAIHFFLASASDLIGSENENLKALPASLFSTISNDGTNYRVSFSDVASLSFGETIHQSGTPDAVGQISIALAEQLVPSNLSGRGFYPDQTGTGNPAEAAGDVVFGTIDPDGTNGDFTSDFDPTETGAWLSLHELGHAVGLLDASDIYTGGSAALNNQKYTVMSTVAHADLSGSDNFIRPTGLQLLDIWALQQIYGANYATRPDDDAYALGRGFGFFADPSALPLGAEDMPFIYTIWDGEGVDEIVASAFDVRAQLDLRQGHFSSIGKTEAGGPIALDTPGSYDAGNVAIAFRKLPRQADSSQGD